MHNVLRKFQQTTLVIWALDENQEPSQVHGAIQLVTNIFICEIFILTSTPRATSHMSQEL